MAMIPVVDERKTSPRYSIIKTDTKHNFVEAFHNECKTIMSIVFLNNPELTQKVRGELVDTYKLKQRTISYFCGTIENEILFLSYKVLIKHGVKRNFLNFETGPDI